MLINQEVKGLIRPYNEYTPNPRPMSSAFKVKWPESCTTLWTDSRWLRRPWWRGCNMVSADAFRRFATI